MFQRILRKCNYHKVEIADDESFKQLSTLSRVMLYTTTNIGFFLAQKKDTRDKIIDLFDTDNAGNVAHTITFGNDKVMETWIQSMHPEALGPLISTLMKDAKQLKIQTKNNNETYFAQQVLAMHQISIYKIINWIYQQYLSHKFEREATKILINKSLLFNSPANSSKANEKLFYYNKCNDIFSRMSKKVNLYESDAFYSLRINEEHIKIKNFNMKFYSLSNPKYGKITNNLNTLINKGL